MLPSKLPRVTLLFWIATILSATVGATVADSVSADLGLGLSATTAIMSLILAGALIVQLSAGGRLSGRYWLVVVLASVVGTLISDDLVDNLGVSPMAAAAILCGALLVAVIGWGRSEHTLSVHTVLTRRRETWYWLVVLCAFALGAAISDLFSEKLSLGHVRASLVFGGLTAVITLAHAGHRLNAVAAFWAAYVVTVPFGDSIGDLLTATPRNGGMGLGTNGTSAAVLTVILVIVALSTAGAHRSARQHDAAA